MKDFEVHSIGTIREIELSRKLADAIAHELDSFGPVVPNSVLIAYNKLKEHYDWQIENGML